MSDRTRHDQLLAQALASVEANGDFTEGWLALRDGSRLWFCHRVGERWVRALDASGQENAATLASQVLQQVTLFRLNAKHLEIWFADGSRWEERFGTHGEPEPSPSR